MTAVFQKNKIEPGTSLMRAQNFSPDRCGQCRHLNYQSHKTGVK